MSDEITGATVGSPSYVVVYFDVNTGNLYNENGQLYGNNTFCTYLDNSFILELHYVKDISTNEDPTQWQVWDGLDGKTISSTVAFDNNYTHAVEGAVVSNAAQGSSKVTISVPNINKDTLSSSGNLVFNPFGVDEAISGSDAPVKAIVSYSSFEYLSGNNFEFTIQDSGGLPIAVYGGTNATPVRVSDPLYIFIDSDSIYEENIPERYSEGVFKIPVDVMSRKLVKAFDYADISGVAGIMEHKIYTKQNSITGIVKGNATSVVLVRGSTNDVYAVDSSDNKNYLFCYWVNTANNSSCYTKGNDIKTGTAQYSVSNGTASISGSTVAPVYSNDVVLYRTFSFPFIVKNLVDYDLHFNIPIDDRDWTKDYIISIIANELGSGTSGSGNLFSSEFTVANTVVSVNAIAMDKITGLTAALDTKLSFTAD